jgi:prepilin-type N-terminal cleavage/methylation domain-containing protein
VRKQRSGFTLFESIVVLVVLLVAAGLAVPTLRGLAGGTPLNAASDMVKSSWAQARSRAISEGRPYRFAIKDNSGEFRVAPDSPEFWDGAGSSAPSSGSSQPPLILEDKLPGDIRFLSGPDSGPSGGGGSGEWSNPIVFLPDGNAQQDATISFGQGGGQPVVLQLQGSTGAVTSSR